MRRPTMFAALCFGVGLLLTGERAFAGSTPSDDPPAVPGSTEAAAADRGAQDVTKADGTGQAPKAPVVEPPKPKITVWTGIRLLGFLSTSSTADKAVGGNLTFDLFRLGAYGEWKQITTEVEARWYRYMFAMKDAWMGYKLTDKVELRLGLQSVPLGIQPYGSNSFYEGPSFLLGLEDEHDVGLTARGTTNGLAYSVSFFKNTEKSYLDTARYSIDVVGDGVQDNEEVNAGALWLAYRRPHLEVGLSGLAGQLYNHTTDRSGTRWSGAAHVIVRALHDRLVLSGQAYAYAYDPADPAGSPKNSIVLGAHLSTFPVAKRGRLFIGTAAYTLKVKNPAIDFVRFYVDSQYYLPQVGAGARSDWYATGLIAASNEWPLWLQLESYAARNVPFSGGAPIDALANDYRKDGFHFALVAVLNYSIPIN